MAHTGGSAASRVRSFIPSIKVFSEQVCAPASRSAAISALRRDLSVARFFAMRALSGFGTVYLVVILVWIPCQSAGTTCGEVGRTVVGRASSSNDDCRSHSSLVGNSGML